MAASFVMICIGNFLYSSLSLECLYRYIVSFYCQLRLPSCTLITMHNPLNNIKQNKKEKKKNYNKYVDVYLQEFGIRTK